LHFISSRPVSNVKLIRTTFLDAQGAKYTRTFHSESALVGYLFASYNTDAPVSFQDHAGNPLDRETMHRIHERLFALRRGSESDREI
jgi:hypothetical protein